MPLQSTHVFASHIGHTGKTTLCYQLSCQYAQAHPDVSVLVMDLAEEGDLTKRLLGGVDRQRSPDDELLGGIFNLLGDADKESSKSRLTSWLWDSSVDITKHAIPCVEHNAHMPPNLYLVSSGAWPTSSPPLEMGKRKAMCKAILESMEKSDKTWKLFCDTDGDRRPQPLTMLAYGLCDKAIVPLHLNKGDLDRTETMLGVLADLRNQGEIETQVLMVVWNMVKSLKEEPCEHRGNQINFTPSKVSLDILDACNQRLINVMRDKELPNLFVHGGDAVTNADFMTTSIAVMRQLADNVLKPSEEQGMPFAQMTAALAGKKQLQFKTAGVEYTVKSEQIENVQNAFDALVGKFESMSLESGGL